MAQPSTRSELITYAKRQLGAPVLEVNVADEQVEDILDDAIQYFQERHFDGVYPTFLKYKITEDDIKRGRSRDGNTDNVGITTQTEHQQSMVSQFHLVLMKHQIIYKFHQIFSVLQRFSILMDPIECQVVCLV